MPGCRPRVAMESPGRPKRDLPPSAPTDPKRHKGWRDGFAKGQEYDWLDDVADAEAVNRDIIKGVGPAEAYQVTVACMWACR